jgi:hypothetical protein
MMVLVVACSRSTPFEVRVDFLSAADPARRYEIEVAGSYPEGADMAEDYRASLSILIGEELHRIRVRAEQFTVVLERIESEKAFAYVTGQPLDVALLTRLIETFDPAAPQDQIAAEANELFTVMEVAGMGPKIGLPKTRAMHLVSASNTYR